MSGLAISASPSQCVIERRCLRHIQNIRFSVCLSVLHAYSFCLAHVHAWRLNDAAAAVAVFEPALSNVITLKVCALYRLLLTVTTPCLNKQSKLFWHNSVKFPPTLIIFGKKWPRGYYFVRCTHLPLNLIYVNALPCETQMLQIVIYYLYQMAHLCIINSTEGATWFNNFEVLNILC